MPKFSKSSLEKLEKCDGRLRDLFLDVVEKYDCTVLCGHRDKLEQNQAFAAGRSKVEWPKSKHNQLPSRAVDVAPYPIDWANKEAFYHFAGYVRALAESKGISIRWGGDWNGNFDLKDQNFFDLPHFELR